MIQPKYSIEIENTKYGQPAPYRDSHYEYIITTDAKHDVKELIKSFCINILCPCSQTFEERQKEIDDGGEWTLKLHSWYKFEELEKNKFKYYVLEPFCD